MLEHLGEIFAGVASRRDLRAVVLCGAGADFCAARTHELEGMNEAAALDKAARGQESANASSCAARRHRRRAGRGRGRRVQNSRWPATCAWPRRARASLCPRRGSASSRLTAGTQRLTRAVGRGARAARCSPAKRYGAERGAALGLVNRVAETSRLLEGTAEALARSIAGTAAPLAARACLEAVTRGARLPLEEALRLEAELFAASSPPRTCAKAHAPSSKNAPEILRVLGGQIRFT